MINICFPMRHIVIEVPKIKGYYCYTAKNVEGEPFGETIVASTRNKARMKFALRYDLPYVDTRARRVRKEDTVTILCHGCSANLSHHDPKHRIEKIEVWECPRCGYKNWLFPKGGTSVQKFIEKEFGNGRPKSL